MGNINVRLRLERISDELDHLLEHVDQYSGIPKKDSRLVESLAKDIIEAAEHLKAEARRARYEQAD